jgi:hypothetical protein
MPLPLGHLNFETPDRGVRVDKWHHDTLPIGFVMMVTDPATLEGGQFEWFRGTKAEAAAPPTDAKTPTRHLVEHPIFLARATPLRYTPTWSYTVPLRAPLRASASPW